MKLPPLLSHRVAVESSPHLVPVLRELQTNADGVVGDVQGDHELGLEAQRNLVLVVAGEGGEPGEVLS